ncbi:hypothetical protein IMCC26134_13160 [Verrucomicrobia bacterium IMCC26134]|jgi:hypothetical protein|nr:hypothetical protein IMCC26134_13160 [Verrucomicrobia bacterium IMCC26134]
MRSFSFDGHAIYFLNPERFAAQGVVPGNQFEELSRGFTRGVLIGFSRVDQEKFQMQLAPVGQALAPGDRLLFIALNAEEIYYTVPLSSQPVKATGIVPPSKQRRRNLCVIGDARSFERLDAFLHVESRTDLRDSHMVFGQPEHYFEPAVIEHIRTGHYDNIVINLEDEVGFRFTLFLLTQFTSDGPILDKIITVLDD